MGDLSLDIQIKVEIAGDGIIWRAYISSLEDDAVRATNPEEGKIINNGKEGKEQATKEK